MLILSLVIPATASAASPPRFIGSANRWIAAATGYGTNRVCYAFTYALPSRPHLKSAEALTKAISHHRDILVVSYYPHHLPEIALRARYQHDGPVLVSVNLRHPPFFARAGYAFARQHNQIIADFRKAAIFYAQVPGPDNQRITDQFSLMGFSKIETILNTRCGTRSSFDTRHEPSAINQK
jgi:hypothetical protein